jgi:hypothetical protein
MPPDVCSDPLPLDTAALQLAARERDGPIPHDQVHPAKICEAGPVAVPQSDPASPPVGPASPRTGLPQSARGRRSHRRSLSVAPRPVAPRQWLSNAAPPHRQEHAYEYEPGNGPMDRLSNAQRRPAARPSDCPARAVVQWVIYFRYRYIINQGWPHKASAMSIQAGPASHPEFLLGCYPGALC